MHVVARCNNREFYLAALRSLDRNAVRAGLVKDPTTYPWSSCAAYALGTPTRVIASNVKRDVASEDSEGSTAVPRAGHERSMTTCLDQLLRVGRGLLLWRRSTVRLPKTAWALTVTSAWLPGRLADCAAVGSRRHQRLGVRFPRPAPPPTCSPLHDHRSRTISAPDPSGARYSHRHRGAASSDDLPNAVSGDDLCM